MPLRIPSAVKVWAATCLFFGTAVCIGIPVAMAIYQKDHAYPRAIATGAFAGAYGICFVCAFLSRARKFFERSAGA
jgi:ethanolamine transporter EutH